MYILFNAQKGVLDNDEDVRMFCENKRNKFKSTLRPTHVDRLSAPLEDIVGDRTTLPLNIKKW